MRRWSPRRRACVHGARSGGEGRLKCRAYTAVQWRGAGPVHRVQSWGLSPPALPACRSCVVLPLYTAALPTPKAKWQRTNPIRSTINIKDKDPSFKIRRVITFLALFDPIRPPDARTAMGNRESAPAPDPPPA